MFHRDSYDLTDLAFRILFSLIFLGLGLEHLVDDNLIRNLMPPWLPQPRFFSMAAGVVLLTGGCSILAGYHTARGAILLGAFLIAVTAIIHLPAVFSSPPGLAPDWAWLWDVYQRSNLVKNLCLLGVCFHLINHKPGRYSLDYRREMAARGGQG